MNFNTFFFGAIIILSLVIFFYIGKFRASEKQRNRDDRISWQNNRFGFLKLLIWVMVSVLSIALLARMFVFTPKTTVPTHGGEGGIRTLEGL